MATSQRTVPLSVRITQRSSIPNETERGPFLMRQSSPWSAHFEYPSGQSLAWAAGAVNSSDTAPATAMPIGFKLLVFLT